jgi:hypothetical protein
MSADSSRSNANGTLNISGSDVREIQKNTRKRRILARISQVTILLGIYAASFAIAYKGRSGYPYGLIPAPLSSLARAKSRWVPAMWMSIVVLVIGLGAGILAHNDSAYPEGSYYGVVSRDNHDISIRKAA